MKKDLTHSLTEELKTLHENGLYKRERIILSPQQAEIAIGKGKPVLNLCANNYLGLANNRMLIEAAQQTLEEHGFGLSSVRFICGTQDIHKELEARLSHFLKMEDTILYSSCFDANGGLFETILGEADAVISDELNHASIIDGIRLCKAKRFRYRNNDMADLEEKLKEAKDCRYRLIVTDGVFSMDGIIAKLHEICDLSDRYDALVMVDDSHAVGFIGEEGRGTPEYCQVFGRIDILTGTLGKALGGASGGYTSGRKPIIDWLRQRSRPYLFSNSLAPMIVGASLKAIELLESSGELRKKLQRNTRHFRSQMEKRGFQLVPGSHPIIPVMIGDAKLSAEFAERLLKEGIYVVSFSYPVVPQGKARIRTQISAAHEIEQLDHACEAFTKIGRELSLLPTHNH